MTTRRDIAAQRLAGQRLAGPQLESIEAVVRWLGAVQAQEYGVAKRSLGQRAAGLTDAAVDGALADGRILRTHVLRDTWHLVRPEDVRWLMALTGPRIEARNATMYRRLGLHAALLASTDDVIAAALAGGAQRTRSELAAVLAGHGVT